MKLVNEKKKARRLTKKLFKYLKAKGKDLASFLHLKSRTGSDYINAIRKDKDFRQEEVFKGKKKLSKLKQKVKVEAKLILNKKFEEDSMNIARKPIIIGMWSTLILFGSFMIWSVTAQVHSTAIANGKIVVDSNKKIIQHLEGGIIEEIFVKGGDMVKEGDQLIRLSETSAKANQELLNKQLFALKAAKLRLMAQRDDKNDLSFQDLEGEYQEDQEFIKILDGERELFEIRRKSLNERIDILTQKKEQLKNEIKGLQSQELAVNQRIGMLGEETKSLDKLFEDGIISRSRYLELKKQTAELEGNKGQYEANIAKVSQAISETELEITNIKTEKLNETLKELQETQTKIADLEERTSASSDVLTRTIITAPTSGIINNLRYHTKGGVISPGAEILEIIPQDDKLIVEVRVNPQDIDVVVVGLDSKVRLSAYKSKAVPMLKGTVTNVSADSFEDQQSGTSFFVVRIKINEGELQKLEEDIRLYPGMPVESYIVTGSRTFLQYLFDPITISMRRAFREE
ncbi:HlyD family type I secretion periplasmic adaptor subunit [Flavobacteriaceae bacterium]|nr:HlyD family type I secretion periplasmic adaptor subunit [Flavobacteriaceae bacterium]